MHWGEEANLHVEEFQIIYIDVVLFRSRLLRHSFCTKYSMEEGEKEYLYHGNA